jgi:uncharacterized protein YehS (DUF1456 family)
MKSFVWILREAAYIGNLGFQEMVMLYQKATEAQLRKLEDIIRKNDESGFRRMVKKILGVTLK